MKTLRKDRAGNRIVKEDDGRIGVRNAKGSSVNPQDSAKFLKQYGFDTKSIGGKLYAKPKRGNSFW